jgi:5-formyltetrahydrofolate cyclo-ligase
MENLKRTKDELRKEVLDKRGLFSIADIKDKSLKIKEAFFNLKEFKAAKNIMFFVSFRSEVMTDFMIKEALAIEKNVIVPLSEKYSYKLKIFYINDFNADLTVGAYGILEPKAVIPGAAFTKNGDRIGYGSGFYDRFLEGLPKNVLKIALTFEQQIVPSIPTSEEDVKMDMIITEKRVINCK